MLEWMKSTVQDMRKYRHAKRVQGRLAKQRGRDETRKSQARLEAERALLMERSEKELLVELLLTMRTYGRDLEALRVQLDILERNVDGVAEGMVDLEFGMSCLDAMVTDLEQQ